MVEFHLDRYCINLVHFVLLDLRSVNNREYISLLMITSLVVNQVGSLRLQIMA